MSNTIGSSPIQGYSSFKAPIEDKTTYRKKREREIDPSERQEQDDDLGSESSTQASSHESLASDQTATPLVSQGRVRKIPWSDRAQIEGEEGQPRSPSRSEGHGVNKPEADLGDLENSSVVESEPSINLFKPPSTSVVEPEGRTKAGPLGRLKQGLGSVLSRGKKAITQSQKKLSLIQPSINLFKSLPSVHLPTLKKKNLHAEDAQGFGELPFQQERGGDFGLNSSKPDPVKTSLFSRVKGGLKEGVEHSGHLSTALGAKVLSGGAKLFSNGLTQGIGRMGRNSKAGSAKVLSGLLRGAQHLSFPVHLRLSGPASLPKALRADPAMAPYREAAQEAKKAAHDYRMTRLQTLASGLGGMVKNNVGSTAALASLGGMIGLLVELLKAKKWNPQAITLEGMESSEPAGEAAAEGLPDLDMSQNDFESLRDQDPELADALNGIFGSLYPEGDLHQGDQFSPGSREAAEEIIQEFKASYNALPAEDRASFLSSFAQEAEGHIDSLNSFIENGGQASGNLQDVWIDSQDFKEQMDGMVGDILSRIEEQPEIPETSNPISKEVLNQPMPNEGMASGLLMGLTFGGTAGGALALLSWMKGRKQALQSPNLQEQRSLLVEKRQACRSLYQNLVVPQLKGEAIPKNSSDVEKV